MAGVQLVNCDDGVLSVLLRKEDIAGDFKSFAVVDLHSAAGGEGSPLKVERESVVSPRRDVWDGRCAWKLEIVGDKSSIQEGRGLKGF